MTLHLPTGAPFSVEQQTWLDGFFAGLDLGRERYQGPAATLTVDVLFGSQTGNSSELADQLAAGLRAAGLGANVTELDAAGVGGTGDRRPAHGVGIGQRRVRARVG
uniref:flavodoxin domain-containing protein n=1 Tax=Corynebacterium variabile TaxID=1727 RepID=UPI0035E3F980